MTDLNAGMRGSQAHHEARVMSRDNVPLELQAQRG